MRIDEAASLVPGVAVAELTDWVARGWVVPGGAGPDWVFAEIHVARARLVRDLRRDAGVEEESVGLVLSLLDQVYAQRRALRAVLAVLDEQPEPTRLAILARLRG